MNDLQKIDSLVAEKVMGWKLNKMGGFYYWVDEKGNDKARASTWQPTLCMSDAWQVVEKLEVISNSFYIGYKVDKNGKKIYRAFFQKEHPITTIIHTYEADAETAPLAICLAALKTVGIEIETEESNNE